MTTHQNSEPLTPKYSPEEIIAKLQAHPKFGSQIKPITKHQSAIISSGLEPAVVIAGAGSGKTETMSNRVLYLVANGFATPDQILGLTFTRKAAGELSVRIRKRLRQLSQLPEFKHITSTSTAVTTYHSYAGKLLSEHAIRYGIDADADPLGEAAIWQIASDVVRNWSDDSYRNDSAVSTVIKDLLGLSKLMLEHQVKASDIEAIGNEMLEKLQGLAGSTPDVDHGQGLRTIAGLDSQFVFSIRRQEELVAQINLVRHVLDDKGFDVDADRRGRHDRGQH